MQGWVKGQRPIVIAASTGLVVAFVLFAATSVRPNAPADFDDNSGNGGFRLSPYAQNVRGSGFDAWTGQPRGWRYTENAHFTYPALNVVYGPIPSDIAGRWAVPLPIGFGLGAVVGYLLVVAARRGRPGARIAPNSSSVA